MIYWDLHTLLPELGKVTIRGVAEGETISFYHPKDESEVVLRVTTDRAREIAAMSVGERKKLNLRLEPCEVFIGREHAREPLQTLQCPHCYAPITWIDSDFLLHSLPWCREWRRTHPKG